jgi:hypothetical protein
MYRVDTTAFIGTVIAVKEMLQEIRNNDAWLYSDEGVLSSLQNYACRHPSRVHIDETYKYFLPVNQNMQSYKKQSMKSELYTLPKSNTKLTDYEIAVCYTHSIYYIHVFD